MKKELFGFLAMLLWLGVVVAFAADFNWQERMKIELLDVYTLRSPVQLLIALGVAALVFSLLLKLLVSAGGKGGIARIVAFALLTGATAGLFALFAKLAVDYRYIFSVNRLSNGIIAVLIFTGGLMWIAVARLFELATARSAGTGTVKRKKKNA
jgi:hypothetical protein